LPASGRTNDLDELTLADTVGNATLDQTFTYDPSGNGNLLSQTDLDELTLAATAARPHAPLTAGAKTFTYDANGNMLSNGARSLVVACPRPPRSPSPGPRARDRADPRRVSSTSG